MSSGRSLARVIAAEGVSVVGDWVLETAVAIEVYGRTHSTFAVSMVFAVAHLPRLILGPLAGAVADRRDRRGIMVGADIASALALLLTVSVADSRFDLVAVYAAVAAVGVFSTFDRPASEAFLPSLVSRETLGRANSALRLAQRLAMIAGPAAGAWLVTEQGMRTVLAADAATFLASALLVVRLPRLGGQAATATESTWATVVSGARYAARAADIRIVVGAIGLTMLGAQIVNAGTIALVSAELHEPASRYGLLLTAEGVGAIAVAILFILVLGPKVPLLPVGASALLLTGATTVAMGLSPNLGAAAAAITLMGVGVVGLQVAFASFLQRRAEDAHRGRVMSLTAMVASGAILLGLVATGPLVNLLGARVAFTLSGTVIMFAALPVFGLAATTGRGEPAMTEAALAADPEPDSQAG